MEQIAALGGHIAAQRKALGMTQEQLAAMLGVSAPAVSKWETGSSYPDITLLCPLARALETNVDTLLQFEDTLSDQQVIEAINGILEQASQGGTREAEARLQALLRQYPNCTALQFNAAAVYAGLQMLHPQADAETQNRWREAGQRLLEAVRASGNGAYWQAATVQLAGLRITAGALEEGEALLRELPERIGDPTLTWIQYFLQKEQPERARAQLQKQLYKLVSEIQTCLLALTNPKLLPEEARQLRACEAYRAVAHAFGLVDLGDGVEMGIRLRMGQTEEAAACFARYVEAVTGPAGQPDPALFAPALETARAEGRMAATPALRRMIVQSIREEPQYQALQGNPTFAAAWSRLQASLEGQGREV